MTSESQHGLVRDLGLALAVGLGVGTSLGIALENLAVGLAVAAGVTMVFALGARRGRLPR